MKLNPAQILRVAEKLLEARRYQLAPPPYLFGFMRGAPGEALTPEDQAADRALQEFRAWESGGPLPQSVEALNLIAIDLKLDQVV